MEAIRLVEKIYPDLIISFLFVLDNKLDLIIAIINSNRVLEFDPIYYQNYLNFQDFKIPQYNILEIIENLIFGKIL